MDDKKGKNSLPVSRVSKAPAPPTVVGGPGYRIPDDPEPTKIPDLPSYYPNDLKVRTRIVLDEARKKFSHRSHALAFCRFVIRELTPEFCNAVKSKDLRADLALSNMDQLLDSLARANSESYGQLKLEHEIQGSDERVAFNKEIGAAERHLRGKIPTPIINAPGAMVESPLGEQITKEATSFPAQVESTAIVDKLDSPNTISATEVEPRARIDDFLRRIENSAGYTVRRKDIWIAAGYKQSTDFEQFQRGDDRTTKSAREAFERVLSMRPEDFLALVQKKKDAQKTRRQK